MCGKYFHGPREPSCLPFRALSAAGETARLRSGRFGPPACGRFLPGDVLRKGNKQMPRPLPPVVSPESAPGIGDFEKRRRHRHAFVRIPPARPWEVGKHFRPQVFPLYHPADRLRNFQASKNSFFRKKWRTGHHPEIVRSRPKEQKGGRLRKRNPFPDFPAIPPQREGIRLFRFFTDGVGHFLELHSPRRLDQNEGVGEQVGF